VFGLFPDELETDSVEQTFLGDALEMAVPVCVGALNEQILLKCFPSGVAHSTLWCGQSRIGPQPLKFCWLVLRVICVSRSRRGVVTLQLDVSCRFRMPPFPFKECLVYLVCSEWISAFCLCKCYPNKGLPPGLTALACWTRKTSNSLAAR